MSSEDLGSGKQRFPNGVRHAALPSPVTEHAPIAEATPHQGLDSTIRASQTWLLDRQQPDGHWVAELEGDTILESEYILLLCFLGRVQDTCVQEAANYIAEQQLPSGGWALYPGGPVEVSSSVKAYFALKLTGHDPQAEHMQRARAAILEAGGVEAVNSFTRYYLALLGVIPYAKCPAIPPELILIPGWMPFNIYEMSAWSRTILVPLSIVWAHQPVQTSASPVDIDELFCGAPADLPVTLPSAQNRDPLAKNRWVNWERVFCGVDSCIKACERLRLLPLRRRAVRKATEWMTDRFADSDGLGAIFPPIIWSVVALKCLGHSDDSPLVQDALEELDRLSIVSGDTRRLQPCQSPVWDTAISLIALRDSGLQWDDPAIEQAANWLQSKEVRQSGDWAKRCPGQEPSGWFFEFRNAFYPDVDDTIMVVMALARCLPQHESVAWDVSLLCDPWSPHEADQDAVAVISARSPESLSAYQEVAGASPRLAAMWRGVRWVLAMQNSDGGWGAFDVDNDRELFTQVPFADHNAMIDPSTADITARVMEMLGTIRVDPKHHAMQRALDFVWQHQEEDDSWYGRWGVNYIYGTWQVLAGLERAGVPADDPRIRGAVRWLNSVQQESGGWGESPLSYDDPQSKGIGPVTASQTAWALLGLMAAGETHSESVRRGVDYLINQQDADGSWDEPWFTGTGFPKVFYLKYHYYRMYFPLMALGRYRTLLARSASASRTRNGRDGF